MTHAPIDELDAIARAIFKARSMLSVVEVLVKEYNLDPKLVTGKGYGESRLLDTKDNEQAHKMNRRIEAIIYALDTQPLKR